MKKIPLLQLVEGLKELPDEDFECLNVYEFLMQNPVNVESIEPYTHWSSKFYTRNLVYKDDRFELMVLCWEKGQYSTIHDHADQMCWMMVPAGKLRGQNFGILEKDDLRSHCKLEKTENFDLADCLSASVELEKPVHQILNLPEFDERAISVHIYSKPFDSCISFCDKTDTFKEVNLQYTSIDGNLRKGVHL